MEQNLKKKRKKCLVDVISEKMKLRQYEDETLQGLKENDSFYVKDSLLYRRHGKGNEQLVIPNALRSEIMSRAHETPLCGHLGKNKTLRRVQNNFFWPGMTKDVRNFCNQCAICLNTKIKRNPPNNDMESFSDII